MSFNKNQINSEEQKDERMLYRPQIWRYKYKSCLEKPLNLKDSYDPDTMNSLKNLIKSTSFEFSQNRFENRKESTRYQSPPYESSNTKIRVNQSQQNLMPQWLKFDKNVLKFTGYFVEHVTESAYENYRIRACNILYYLEDDAIHVVELKSENSGIVQGDLIKRRRIQYNDLQDPTNKKDISWKDLNLQKNVIICV